MDSVLGAPRFLGDVEVRVFECIEYVVIAYVIRELRRRPEMTLRESVRLQAVLWREVFRG